MSEDRREGQSKFDRPAAASGLTRLAAPAAPAAPAEPTPGGPATPAPPPVPPAPVAAPAPAVTPAPAKPVFQAVRAPAPSAATPATPMTDAEADAEADDGSDYEEDEMPPTFVERLRRLSPAPVLLTIGSIGSLVFLFLSVTSHTTPVAVLLSAAVVTGLIFGADAVIASVVTWRASQSGETGMAFLGAVVGGVASLVCFGAFAGTLVLILVLNS
ncbi:MAG: hypothetical protein ABSC46_10640 [Candidatus Limnocylindrales bacterium]